jgi:hypothetical protein
MNGIVIIPPPCAVPEFPSTLTVLILIDLNFSAYVSSQLESSTQKGRYESF